MTTATAQPRVGLQDILIQMIAQGEVAATVAVETAVGELLRTSGDEGFEMDDLLMYLREIGEADSAHSFERAAQIAATQRLYGPTVSFAVTPDRPARPEGARAMGHASAEDLWFQVAHAYEGPPEARRARYAPLGLRIRPGDRVLDLGCGDGTFLEIARGRGADVLGLDLDPEKVEACLARGIPARLGKIQEVEFEGQFDFVSMLHIIEHVPPAEALEILRRIWCVLSPKGRLLLLTPNISHPVVQTNFWLDVTHIRPYPELLLNTFVATLGFPYFQSGTMAEGLETWCYAFRSAEHEYR